MDCSLYERLLVVNRHYYCHAMIAVHLLSLRLKPSLSVTDCIAVLGRAAKLQQTLKRAWVNDGAFA